MKIKAIHIKHALIQFGKAFVASLFCWAMGGIALLFCFGAAGLALIQGDVTTAHNLLSDWSVPMFVGGALSSIFTIWIYEHIRRKEKHE